MKNDTEKRDEIWKALADRTRREILDALAERPHMTGELVERFDHLCRTNVMKHVAVLVEANLVFVRREGRTRWNHINPAPIQAVCDRWVSKHVRKMASSMARLKAHVEKTSSKAKRSNTNIRKVKTMVAIETTAAACHQYELEIEIEAPRERVWKAIFDETNLWWLPDFHVAGPDSVVTLDPKAGGRGLIEETPDGASLLWYSVQMYLPSDFKVYLIGHVAPEWGGPTTSSLKLALEETDSGCKLIVCDARHGKVDEKSVQSYAAGWQNLFSDGLKAFVEK